jgi:uncharacterized protein
MKRTAEVEFLLEREGEIVPVEVKSGWVTQSKSLKVYMERYRPARAFVLSANNTRPGGAVRHLPLYAARKLGAE